MPNQHEPPKIDLIQLVQQARMQHDDTAQPSQINAMYWIEAKAPAGQHPAVTVNSGYWRILTTRAAVDALWQQIKTATQAGTLGYKSKVATAPARGDAATDPRRIHVCTYDGTDAADVERVRRALEDFGITEGLVYEMNAADPAE
jgi:hypothetical protein